MMMLMPARALVPAMAVIEQGQAVVMIRSRKLTEVVVRCCIAGDAMGRMIGSVALGDTHSHA